MAICIFAAVYRFSDFVCLCLSLPVTTLRGATGGTRFKSDLGLPGSSGS